jgi:hypothetical protein
MEIVDVKQFISLADGTRRYAWKTIPANEALKIPEPRLRCPECKGAVRLFRKSSEDATLDRAEHKTKNPGCSLCDCFTGTKRLAVNPIEPGEPSINEAGIGE